MLFLNNAKKVTEFLIFGSYSMFRGVVTTFINQLRLSFTRSAIAGIKS